MCVCVCLVAFACAAIQTIIKLSISSQDFDEVYCRTNIYMHEYTRLKMHWTTMRPADTLKTFGACKYEF